MNQIAYAANNAAAVAANSQASYNFGLAPSGFSSQGCQPTAGPSGTKIQMRISGHYDIMAMTSTAPYAWVLFGSTAQRLPAQIMKEAPHDASGACSYSITVEAPPFLMTNWQTSSNVPLTVVIESADGSELARVGSAGSFTYTDTHTAGGAGDLSQGAAGSPPDESITRRSTTRSPPSHEHDTSVLQVNSPPSLTVRTSATTSPTTEHIPGGGVGVGVGAHQHDVADPTATNTYGYPPGAVATHHQAQVPLPQQALPTSAYNQGNDTMLHAYRTSNNYSHHHYQRSPTSLRSPHHGLGGWGAPYGSLDSRSSGYPAAHHTHTTRPSLTPSLPMPTNGPPALVRTTTIPQGNPSMGLGGAYSPFTTASKATLHITGNLESMAAQWTGEEWENKRRIVMFKKQQTGSRLTASFRPVPVNERPPNSICISCIWWEEKQDCFVTSVDTIHLLEQLVAAPNRFTVEEKNRIRRNLEGYKPLTVSKAKADSEDFFKVIMGFGNPKPRNIEKDVKVFPWKVLGSALKKIIGKYSASPSSTMPQSTHHAATAHAHHMLTPVSVGSNYGLPPTPTTATDPTSASGYIGHASLSDQSIPSPRSLTGGAGGLASSWATYSQQQSRDLSNSRALSPTSGVIKTASSPGSSNANSLRLSAIPTAYDTRGSQQQYGLPSQGTTTAHTHHGGGHHHTTQHGHGGNTGRWDYNAISADTTGAYGAGTTARGGGGGAGGGYDYGAYGDGTSQRA